MAGNGAPPISVINSDGVHVKQVLRRYSAKGTQAILVHHHQNVIEVSVQQLIREWRNDQLLIGVTCILSWNCEITDPKTVYSEEVLIKELPWTGKTLRGDTTLPNELLHTNRGKNTALVIYNLHRHHLSASIMKKLLAREVLPNTQLIICTQYNVVESLAALTSEHQLFTILGIDSSDVLDSLRMMSLNMRIKYIDKLIDYIRVHPELHDLCRNPEMAKHVLAIYGESKCQCPVTLTLLYKGIIEGVVTKHLKLGTRVDINDLDEDTKDHFDAICSVAYLMVKKKCQDINKIDFSTICLKERIPGSGSSIGLGLAQPFVHEGKYNFEFLHLSIQECLAAVHISQLPYFEQAFAILTPQLLSDQRIGRVFRFFCGLSHTNVADKAPLKISKIVLVPLLESVACTISLVEEPDLSKTLFILTCLYETQDPSIVKKFVQKRQAIFNLRLEDKMQSEAELKVLAFVIFHSGIDQWQIETPIDKRYVAEYLVMLVNDLCQSSSEMTSKASVQVVDGSTYLVYPSSSPQQLSLKLKANIYCRILRELIHRLSQYYSPIKLKSDGSNAAYISLRACKCLECAMDAQQFLIFEPIVASHWLPMKSKGDSSPQEDTQQNRVHMVQHDGQFTELVIMTTPLPHRIRFIIPVTGQEVCIELCTNDSPDFLWSGIESCLSLDTTLRHCIPRVDTATGVIVLPSLPLPKQTNSRVQTVMPDAPEPMRNLRRHQQQQPIGQTALAISEAIALPVVETDGRQGQGQGQLFLQSRQQLGGGTPFNVTTGSTFVQQGRPQRQSTLKPGVIVHSVIPDIFVSDQQYPLPDESCLVRKGGNGEIYLGMFSGKELIVKKTAYRSREITIHRKLNHRNIVTLLSVMMGEKYHAHPRKLTCYHFLQRATGDLARLLVDNECNTLRALREKYAEDILKFGIISGNLKYALAQVLEGLVYLHEQNIVHRDLKASNILLYFHCSCPNLLLCSCARKCGLQIADYDSAVELSMDNHLPASNSSKSSQSGDKFLLIPVGTTGYRPPESSLHMVSNDTSVFFPQVTTCADMWSFGILLMKMLNGQYGPGSQRELSTLMLYYYQQHKKPQPGMDTRRRPVTVTLTEVDKILKIPRLQSDIWWSPKATDCVRQCLKVDPVMRWSAKELLSHPFLH